MIELNIVCVEGTNKMPETTKEDKLVKQEPTNVAIKSQNMLAEADGLAGFEDSDLPVPMVKLVTNRSNETLLQDGNPAPANQFFNTSTKEVITPFVFRIIAVANGDAWSKLANNGQGAMIKKIVFYGRDEKSGDMFFMPISSSYAYWEFRNRVLPILNKALKAGHNIADVVLTGDKATADNKSYGKVTYPVFKLEGIKPLADDVKNSVLSLQSKFKEMAKENLDRDGDEEKATGHAGDSSRSIDDVQLPA